MAITAFNTHKVAEVLSGAGFPKEQVNAQVHILTEVTGELVTKSFLRTEMSDLRTDLRTEMLGLRTEISDLKTEFRNEMSLQKKDLTISLGLGQVALMALMLTIIKFIIV